MSTLNEFNSITTPMLERHLAIKQLMHYLHVEQTAINSGDQQEHRRAKDVIDKLVIEYGVSAFQVAQGRYQHG
ncbi:hypothetical protein D3C71_577710 [compost metagenome]